MPGELVRAERRLTELGDGGACLLAGEVGEMARRLTATRGVEDEGQGSHDGLHGPTACSRPGGRAGEMAPVRTAQPPPPGSVPDGGVEVTGAVPVGRVVVPSPSVGAEGSSVGV